MQVVYKVKLRTIKFTKFTQHKIHQETLGFLKMIVSRYKECACTTGLNDGSVNRVRTTGHFCAAFSEATWAGVAQTAGDIMGAIMMQVVPVFVPDNYDPKKLDCFRNLLAFSHVYFFWKFQHCSATGSNTQSTISTPKQEGFCTTSRRSPTTSHSLCSLGCSSMLG